MFGGLMRWIGSKTDPVPQRREPFIQGPASVDGFKEYLKAEIYKSPLVKPKARERMLEDMLKRASPTTPRDQSSALQKSIQSYLDDSALKAASANPKKAVTAIYQRARGKHDRRSDLARQRKAGITAYRPSSAGDQRECAWCLGMAGEILPISQDFDDLAEGNCTCEYCRCCLLAHIPGVTGT